MSLFERVLFSGLLLSVGAALVMGAQGLWLLHS